MPSLTDESFEILLRVGHAQEVESYRTEINRLEREYAAPAISGLAQSEWSASASVSMNSNASADLLATARRDFDRSFLNRAARRADVSDAIAPLFCLPATVG